MFIDDRQPVSILKQVHWQILVNLIFNQQAQEKSPGGRRRGAERRGGGSPESRREGRGTGELYARRGIRLVAGWGFGLAWGGGEGTKLGESLRREIGRAHV